jgi:surface antigen
MPHLRAILREMFRRALALFAVSVAVAALAGIPAGTASRPSLLGSALPIVYGYPYAGRCPGAGLADVVDRWGMYACNCTSYVAWALSANRQRIDWFVRGSMDAWNWPNVARRAGLTVDRTPATGAVAVWPRLARPFGHVAYVTGVGPGRTVDVAEYNFPSLDGTQTFRFETRSSVRVGDAVFIHVPRTTSRGRGAAPSP